MVRDESRRQTSLAVPGDRPLIAVIPSEDGDDATHYFATEDAADAVLADDALRDALEAIGSWSDLDWDETVAALDRIRHERVC